MIAVFILLSPCMNTPTDTTENPFAIATKEIEFFSNPDTLEMLAMQDCMHENMDWEE